MHPHVFKHQFSTLHGYADSALKLGAVLAPVAGGLVAQFASQTKRGSEPSTSRVSRATWLGVGTAAVAAIGTAAATTVMSNVGSENDPYRWITEHLMFVRALWDTEANKRRLEACATFKIPFHCFYTRIVPPPQALGTNPTTMLDPTTRTFILVPDEKEAYAPYFSPLDSVCAMADLERRRRNRGTYDHVPGTNQPIVL